jgi:DNA polymerase III sliding clamp (beta) subunit (PCNA family)
MKVNKNDLLSQLEMASSGLSKREMIKQSDCFVFIDGRLHTYNEEVSCSCDSVLENFTAAVKAEPLLSVLRKMTEENIEIKFTDSEFIIRGKRREAGIRLEKEIELPLETVEKPEDWKSLSSEFDQAVQLVSQCTSTDETQFRLTCVHITPNELEASDRFQASRYKLNTEIESKALIRKDTLKSIVDLGMNEISETDDWLHFRNPAGLVISCRRYSTEENEFPDLESIYDFEGQKTKLPAGITEAVEKAEIFSSDNLDSDMIMVQLKPGKLQIKGEGNLGWFTEFHDVNYTGSDLRFRIAPKMLIEISNQHDECELNESLIKVENDNFVYVTLLSIAEDE